MLADEGELAALGARLAVVEERLGALDGFVDEHVEAARKGQGDLREDFEKLGRAHYGLDERHRLWRIEAEQRLAVVEEHCRQLEGRLDEVEEVQRANQEGMGEYQRATTARLEQLEGACGAESLRDQAERLIEAITGSTKSTLEALKLLQTRRLSLEARVTKLEAVALRLEGGDDA